MSKVPCGGFKLDNNFLGMNENDELSLTGGGEGKAYQYVVTDGDGNAKWEDRLAYSDSRVVVKDIGPNEKPTFYVKVADEIPEWASVDAYIKFWMNDGKFSHGLPDYYFHLGNGGFIVNGTIVFNAVDNTEYNGENFSIVFPEKGVYFISADGRYVTGVASADSDTPEITWDGNVETIKTIDPKYIPSELNEVILPSSTSGSSKKFKITVNDAGAITATEVTT